MNVICRCKRVEILTLIVGLTMCSAVAEAANITGQARAVQATVLGTTTVLADTGTLSGPDDARDAGLLTGSIANLGGMEVLQATAIASGVESIESVASEASLGGLNLGIAGNAVSADFVMAEAFTPASGTSEGSSIIDGLLINGTPVTVSGAPNQTVSLIGGRVVINEQQPSATGIVVNALHIVVDGVADVVIGSATSGVAPSPSSVLSPTLGTLPLF